MYISEYVISIHIDVVAHGSVEIRSFGSVTHTSIQHNANSDLSLILVHTTFAVSERLEYTGISPNTIPPSKRYW